MDYGNDGFAIHCGKYVDQQGIGSITMRPAPNAEPTEKAPDELENFLNSDFFALFKDDHILSIGAGKNAASLRVFLQGLFEIARLPEESRQFDLRRIGDVNKLAMIRRSGVKSIDLAVELSDAAGEYILEEAGRPSLAARMQAAIIEPIKSVILEDRRYENLVESEFGRVKFSISLPSKDLEIAKSSLDAISMDIVADEDSDFYSIQLSNGEVIKPSETALRKSEKFISQADSINSIDAWTKMRKYLRELRDDGHLQV